MPFSHFVPIYLTLPLPYFPFSQSKLANTPFSFLSHHCLKPRLFLDFFNSSPFFGEALQALLPTKETLDFCDSFMGGS
jgi:hypothetical protein